MFLGADFLVVEVTSHVDKPSWKWVMYSNLKTS